MQGFERFNSRWQRALLGGGRSGAIAIEFRDDVARLVQVDPTQGTIIAAARVTHDPAQPALTAQRIRIAVDTGGFMGTECVIGLPFEATRAEAMSVEDATDDVLEAMVEREAPLRFGWDSPQIGFIRLSRPINGRVEIAVVAANRTLVEQIVAPIVDVGLLPDAAEPSFISAARVCCRLYRRRSDESRLRVAVDASRSGAIAMLLAGARIAYCRSVDDPQLLPGAVASCLHDGLAYMSPLLKASEIRLLGAYAEDPAMAAMLERDCGLPVRLDDDRSTIGTAWRSIPQCVRREDRPWDWGATLGLALRGSPRRVARERRQAPREAA